MVKGKAAGRPAPKAARKPKQAFLPGAEQERFEDLIAAAEEYVEIKEKRMALSEKELGAREEVARLLKVHGLTSYMYDGMEIVLDEKIKVRKIKGEAL